MQKKKLIKITVNISFIVPCYNCESYIKNNIYKLYKKLKNLKIKYEIILVDDHSSDKTFFYIKELKTKIPKLKILKNTKNFGKSFSLIKGIRVSKYKYTSYVTIALMSLLASDPIGS